MFRLDILFGFASQSELRNRRPRKEKYCLKVYIDTAGSMLLSSGNASQHLVPLHHLPFTTQQESDTVTMLSTRGTAWSKVGFLHGKQNAYHPIRNPKGVVALNNAENVAPFSFLKLRREAHEKIELPSC